MERRKALVSLVIGETYQAFWKKYCEPNWRPYAEKWGYDIILIDDHIDRTERGQSRTPHWQKCLILEHPDTKGYDNLVWLDADVAINFSAAPCIVGSMKDPDAIGCVRWSDYATPDFVDNTEVRFSKSAAPEMLKQTGWVNPATKYGLAGLPQDIDDKTNTGVLVLNHGHAPILRQVYDEAEENAHSGKEQTPLSYHLLKSGAVEGLDRRFNVIWDHVVIQHYPFLLIEGFEVDVKTAGACVNTAFVNSYFLHFIAGHTRNFLALLRSDAAFPGVYHAIRKQFPDDRLVIGKTHPQL